jgi:hypothetical protein
MSIIHASPAVVRLFRHRFKVFHPVKLKHMIFISQSQTVMLGDVKEERIIGWALIRMRNSAELLEISRKFKGKASGRW